MSNKKTTANQLEANTNDNDNVSTLSDTPPDITQEKLEELAGDESSDELAEDFASKTELQAYQLVTAKQEIVKADPSTLNVKSFEELTLGDQLKIFREMSTDTMKGITNPAMGLLKFQKAKELRLPWANALPHMHIIKGKVGLDINLCQAIVGRPGSGIRWEYVEEYQPLFDYLDAKGTVYAEDSLPPNVQIVNKLSDPVEAGKTPIILFPQPVDWRTIIRFTRKKKDIDGTFFTVEELGKFSWRDALRAKLPNPNGTIDPNSNWAKRPKFMIYKSAFWDGAKKIANDLLMGSYDPDDLRAIP